MGLDTARAVTQQITHLLLECLSHPAPDSAPCDYHVFRPLSGALGGKKISRTIDKRGQSEYLFSSGSLDFSEAVIDLH